MWYRASGTLISTDTHEELRWEDGVLTGTLPAVTEFRNIAEDNNHMLNPWSVIGITEFMFKGFSLKTFASEDFPTRPPIPEGAMG